MPLPVRRFLGLLPVVLALAVYLVLIAGPTTPPTVVDGRVGSPADHEPAITGGAHDADG